MVSFSFFDETKSEVIVDIGDEIAAIVCFLFRQVARLTGSGVRDPLFSSSWCVRLLYFYLLFLLLLFFFGRSIFFYWGWLGFLFLFFGFSCWLLFPT